MAVPEIREPDRRRAADQKRGKRRAPEAGEEQAAEHHAGAPGSEHEPVAEVARVKGVLRECDLDGKDEGEEDERDRLGGDAGVEGRGARERR